MPEVVAGAEPYSAAGGSTGVLVLHGFTGSPYSMRPLAEAFAAAGLTVELPRLPGHGTSVEDMSAYRFDDWAAAADAAYGEARRPLRAGGRGGPVDGRHARAVAGGRAPGDRRRGPREPAGRCDDRGHPGHAGGAAGLAQPYVPGIGSDIAAEGVEEGAYPLVPVAGLLSLLDGAAALMPRLPALRPPLLLLSSPQDHVVEPASSDHLEAHSGSPVRRVLLPRSYHVATLDLDRELIEREAVAFVHQVTA